MNEQYYIRLRGRVTGPYDSERLKALATRGQFSRMHEVSPDGMDWTNAGTLVEVFGDQKSSRTDTDPISQVSTTANQQVPSGSAYADPGQGYAATETERSWFFYLNGQENGPVSETELLQLAGQGKLVGEDLIWTQGMAQWQPACELFPTIASAVEEIFDLGVDSSSYNVPREEQETSLLAIGSIVFGLLWVFGLGSIGAIVMGGLALHQIESSEGHIRGRNLAIAGLGIGIIGTLSTTIAFCLI